MYYLQEESSAEEQEKPEEKEVKGEKKKKHKKHKKHGGSKHKHKRSKHKKHKEKDRSPGVSAFYLRLFVEGLMRAWVGGYSLEDSVNPRISARLLYKRLLPTPWFMEETIYSFGHKQVVIELFKHSALMVTTDGIEDWLIHCLKPS